MTIKFKEATAAQACVLKMNGRFFDGRKVSLCLCPTMFKRSVTVIDHGGRYTQACSRAKSGTSARPRVST